MTAADNTLRVAGAERGFTLIEALVAFVVLAVGIIGIISLLIMSKNSLHQSVQRTQAINLADAMVERIRINPTAIATYDDADLANPVGESNPSTPPAVDCAVNRCSPAELATFDLWSWKQSLMGESVVVDGENVGGLIDPRACITFTAQNGLVRSGLLNVVIQWHGLEESNDAVPADGVACGGADPGQDPHRRQVVVNTFVVDESEF